MAYLLDANVFIQAKNLHYGMNFCPAFWDWLIEQHHAGTVYSIEKVGDELLAGADDHATWASARGGTFFRPPASTAIASLHIVSAWVTSQQYAPAAVSTFLQVADFYLVAQALAGTHVVVTHEVVSPSAKRIKIPNVCVGLNVKCVTPYEMLRRERARFVLGAAPNQGDHGSGELG